MELQKPIFMYEEESQAEKLARKSKETPIFPIGKNCFTKLLVFKIYKHFILQQLLRWRQRLDLGLTNLTKEEK